MAKMTLAEAAEVWIESKRAFDAARSKMDVAKEILLDHFRKTNRRHYRNRVAYSVTTRTVLDTRKVKEELADRLEEFQRRQSVETLSLIEQ